MTTIALFQVETRFDRMATELEYAVRNTSGDDLTKLLGHLVSDGGSALARRVTNIWDLAGNIIIGTVNEVEGAVNAYSDDRLTDHLGSRIGRAARVTTDAVSNGVKSLSSLIEELKENPAESAPKLLVLVLSSVAASGGVDGNGGIPDLDIPLMGIGAHRSMLTHSIIIGSVLETALLLLTRIVLCTHKNLPPDHDSMWNALVQHSIGILKSAGQGASIGIAYHLMVDAVVQPGAYHGVPFDMPMEAHQTIMAANSMAEGASVIRHPEVAKTSVATPDVLAEHNRFINIQMTIPLVLQAWLVHEEIDILTKHGAWMQALVKGVIPPTTLKQLQFVNAARGLCKPIENHEKAWISFMCAKELAGWKTHG